MKQSGFTLLETIIYCALFSVLMTSALITVYALMNSNEVTHEQTKRIAEASFIQQKLEWVFSNATDVTIINAETIEIIRADLQTQNPLLLEFTNNNLYFSRGTSDGYILVNPKFQTTLISMQYINSKVTIVYRLNSTMFRFETYIN